MFSWIPTSVGKFYSFGRNWIKSDRTPLPNKELLPWAGRLERAYTNLKDYFPAYVVAILLLGHLGKFDEGTKLASMLFVIGRVSHYIVYGLNITYLRFLTFLIAIGSNLYLLIKLFL
jgi:uncharacterized MAPEG superfamily protein